MRVLGIDCGTEKTGYGVIDSDGVIHRAAAYGVIRTSPRDSLSERLSQIARELREVIQTNRPECAAVEEVFFAVNVKTALKLSHVRGVALLVVAEAGLPMDEYAATEVKSSVVGYGRADKHQVQVMVKSILRLDEEIASQDAADAIAVAICHATRQFTRLKMGLVR